MPSPDALAHADLVFVIDTTASMGGFLEAAKRTLLDTLSALSGRAGVDLEVGLVEFRDHPPQDNSFITRATPLTADFDRLQSVITQLSPAGGGDGPEAVYQGVWDALALEWRPSSARYLLLVGDAPPHAFPAWLEARTGEKLPRGGDGWPDACPSGHDPCTLTAAAEDKNVRIFAICVSGYAAAAKSFEALAQMTGGLSEQSQQGQAVVDKLDALLGAELAEINFDRAVLERAQAGEDAAAIAEALDEAEVRVAASLTRLAKRGFLDDPR